MEELKKFNASPKMGLVESLKTCLSKYATFKGRARRSEFWWWMVIVNGVINIYIQQIFSWKLAALAKFNSAIASAGLDTDFTAMQAQAESVDSKFTVFMVIGVILMLLVLLPNIAVLVRRLHDVGKSGWFMLIALIPIIGSIILLIFNLKDSDPNPNQYGPSPKYTPAV